MPWCRTRSTRARTHIRTRYPPRPRNTLRRTDKERTAQRLLCQSCEEMRNFGICNAIQCVWLYALGGSWVGGLGRRVACGNSWRNMYYIVCVWVEQPVAVESETQMLPRERREQLVKLSVECYECYVCMDHRWIWMYLIWHTVHILHENLLSTGRYRCDDRMYVYVYNSRRCSSGCGPFVECASM